jgi:putative membrane protein
VIPHYSDHAANERTFLAWIRTAIAVAAFGFLVEKFDLVLDLSSRSSGGRVPSRLGEMAANVTGLLMIVLAGIMMVLATIRFRRTTRAIDAEEIRRSTGVRTDTALVGLLLFFGGTLFLYMAYSVLERL